MTSKLKIYALQNLSDEFVVDKGVLLTFTFKDVMDMVAKSICNVSVFARFADDLNWHHVVKTMTMSEAMIDRFANYLDWDLVAEHQHMSESFIACHITRFSWRSGDYYQQLSFDFVQTHPVVDLDRLFYKRQYLWSDEQFGVYIGKYPKIWRTQHLSEQFIEENIERVDWMELSNAHRQWSDDFFSRHYTRFSKWGLLTHAILNESQIERALEMYPDAPIASRQVLSEAIIRRYSSGLRWCQIAAFQTLSSSMIEYIQTIEDWTASDMFVFSTHVNDFDKVSQFPLLCDWRVLSGRSTIPESILIENEDRVVWREVWTSNPSDTFLAAYHHWLDSRYISYCASEQFLSAHPRYITSDALHRNERIISMSFLFNHLDVLGRQNVINFPGISVNLRRKIANQ